MESYIGTFVTECLKHGWTVYVNRDGGHIKFICNLGNDSWGHHMWIDALEGLKYPAAAARADVKKFFIKGEKKDAECL